jgi:F0F1-type ATP synthase membrane subunit a
MIANLVFLGLGLIAPMIVAWWAVTALHQTRPVAIALVVTISSVILGLETYGAMRFLGRGLGRAEPVQTA